MKQGTKIQFKFVGTWINGTLDEMNEKLTNHYGTPWYWCREEGTSHRYPVSIKDIKCETKS